VLKAGIDERSNCTNAELPGAMFIVAAVPKFVPGAAELM
jgi:hypothetical protein